jgi:hypothetical protein
MCAQALQVVSCGHRWSQNRETVSEHVLR